MDAKQVIDKILADAKAEAQKISAEAKEKENADDADFSEQLDEYKKQTKVLAEKAAKDCKSHILAAARMDIARQHGCLMNMG